MTEQKSKQKNTSDIPESDKGFFRNMRDRLTPQYDEASAFYISLAVWIMAIYNFDEMFIPPLTALSWIILAIIIIGSLLSIYHAFSNTNKPFLIKIVFMYYLAFITGIISIGATIYQITLLFDQNGNPYLLLIPMLGIYYTLAISTVMTHDWNKASNKFSDRNASIIEIIIGSTVIVATSLICRYYFNLHWTITLSICVIYVIGIHRFIRKQVLSET